MSQLEDPSRPAEERRVAQRREADRRDEERRHGDRRADASSQGGEPPEHLPEEDSAGVEPSS